MRGSVHTGADLVPYMDAEGRDRPTETLPKLFGITIPHAFPSELA